MSNISIRRLKTLPNVLIFLSLDKNRYATKVELKLITPMKKPRAVKKNSQENSGKDSEKLTYPSELKLSQLDCSKDFEPITRNFEEKKRNKSKLV